jgi:hypothetical protein
MVDRRYNAFKSRYNEWIGCSSLASQRSSPFILRAAHDISLSEDFESYRVLQGTEDVSFKFNLNWRGTSTVFCIEAPDT